MKITKQIRKAKLSRDIKKVFEPVIKPIKDVSEDVTKTMKVTAEENKKADADLIKNFSDLMIDRSKIASYLVSPLYKITNSEHTSQFTLVKDTD